MPSNENLSKEAKTGQAGAEPVTEETIQYQSDEIVNEPVKEQQEESSELAETTASAVSASWRASSKEHEGLNVNSILKFSEGVIWNFSDCVAVGRGANRGYIIDTEADFGFTVSVKDDNTVIVNAYDNSNTGIVPVSVIAELATNDYANKQTADTYEIKGYADCGNGLGIISVLFSDDSVLTAGIYKESGKLYTVNINEEEYDATHIVNCRLLFKQLMDKAGITEKDAVYTDPIYYPIVPMNAGETTDTAYWLAESSKITKPEWSDARKVMTFYNYVVDNLAYDDWIVSKGERLRCIYYGDYSGKYYTSQTKVGICEDFAQIIAIMCRAQGIPALEIHTDKHAMTAAYIKDYGRWIFIDPTADIKSDVYQEDYTSWKYSKPARYNHLDDISDQNFQGIGIGNYEDMKLAGIPVYE